MRIFGLAHLTKDIILKENVWYSFFLPYAQRDKPLTKTLFKRYSQLRIKPLTNLVLLLLVFLLQRDTAF